jgi:methylglutaconyl-CoA hydratase
MLKIDRAGAVVRLTMDRPDVRNALGTELLTDLADVLDQVEADASVRVVVLTGAGQVFSAGADLSSMKTQSRASADENRGNALDMGAVFHRVYSFPKPVVARVPGPAIGGGVGLMAACDVVIAVESAFFSFSEVRLGIVPALISPFCIRRLGASVARRLFLTGAKLTAERAAHYGLVDEVITEGELDTAVDRTVDALLRGGPLALAEAKRLVDAVASMGLEEALPHTADTLARIRAGDEAREGVTAFLEKRRPRWAPPKD